MKRIVQLLPVCLIAIAAIAAGASDTPVFQIRSVLDAPTDASEQMTLVYTNTSLGLSRKEVLNVQKKVLLDQSAVKSASAITDRQTRGFLIEITFTDKGKTQFAEVTRHSIDRRLAIIIDGHIYAAPAIRAEIPGGKFKVSGSFTWKETRELAAKINQAVTK